MRYLVKVLVTMSFVGLLWSGAASAQQTASGDVQEKDYPCAIVLCLANPNGPMSVSQCVPPVKWLIKNFIEKLKPWPACMGPDGNTIANYRSEQHVDCPSGFTAEVASTEYGSVMTGVCLRAVPTCNTTGKNAYSPSIAGAACYTIQTDNYNDHFSQITTSYLEAFIPGSGVTDYAMTLASGNRQTFYFNLGGASANLGASIIYRNNNANSYSGAYGG